MSARGRRKKGHGEEESDERWLLTYADMITLLMALFMVLFSISVVNKSKFETLQRSLKEAFSGKILPGGSSIAQAGSNPTTKTPAPDSPFTPAAPSVVSVAAPPGAKGSKSPSASNAQNEDQTFRTLKAQIDRYARHRGLSRVVSTTITPQGLRIRLLTDKVVFDSGSATVNAGGRPLIGEIATILDRENLHPIQVDGHTDDRPISTARFPDNWALSVARATSVVSLLIDDGVPPARLGAGGYAWYRPADTNTTAAGRARNRRVEILIQRLKRPLPTTSGVTFP